MKAAQSCECLAKVNKALERHGTKLVECFSLLASSGCAVVASEKIPTLRRVKPKTVIASYCPFCGKKYPPPPPHGHPHIIA